MESGYYFKIFFFIWQILVTYCLGDDACEGAAWFKLQNNLLLVSYPSRGARTKR